MNKRIDPAIMAAFMLAMCHNPYYSTGVPKRTMSDRQRKRYEEEKRARAHAICPINVSVHEFVIHGEKIMARNRKTALKIYAKRFSNRKR